MQRHHWTMGDEDQGGPDGATVDSQGGLWEAHAGNWKVRHVATLEQRSQQHLQQHVQQLLT